MIPLSFTGKGAPSISTPTLHAIGPQCLSNYNKIGPFLDSCKPKSSNIKQREVVMVVACVAGSRAGNTLPTEVEITEYCSEFGLLRGMGNYFGHFSSNFRDTNPSATPYLLIVVVMSHTESYCQMSFHEYPFGRGFFQRYVNVCDQIVSDAFIQLN
jgi:hypothetical protein